MATPHPSSTFAKTLPSFWDVVNQLIKKYSYAPRKTERTAEGLGLTVITEQEVEQAMNGPYKGFIKPTVATRSTMQKIINRMRAQYHHIQLLNEKIALGINNLKRQNQSMHEKLIQKLEAQKALLTDAEEKLKDEKQVLMRLMTDFLNLIGEHETQFEERRGTWSTQLVEILKKYNLKISAGMMEELQTSPTSLEKVEAEYQRLNIKLPELSKIAGPAQIYYLMAYLAIYNSPRW